MSIVRIALDVPLPTLFDYMVDSGIEVSKGQRVVVQFGSRQMLGVVMETAVISDVPHERIKQVTQVLHDSAALSSGLLDLLRFCSDYYLYPVGQTVFTALPARLRSIRPETRKTMLIYRLSASGAAIDLNDFPKRKVVQRRILAKLAEHPCNIAQIMALSASAAAQLKSLVHQGYVDQCDAIPTSTAGHTFENAHTLTGEQQQAVDAVEHAQGYECFLLHGITGSGKTEAYVHMMHHKMLNGGQVLLLVPEINLTPQMEHYFHSRFPGVDLISLHSGLSEGERLHNWQLAQSGTAQIVLGTRLAVFAELPRLELIIVDEEHDSSFKQQDGLRYSARDVAIFRAHQCGIPVVLGSATPSLESYHNAQIGRYQLLKLTERAQDSSRLPDVRCINIDQTVMHHGISESLLGEIGQRIARHEQSLIFINRRGYAPVLMCTDCGWISGCQHCAGNMVLHLNEHRLRCHHCGYQIRVPQACPSCGNAGLHPVGSGTQRVESVLQERFPDARILRVDRDSTRNKRAWRNMREQIRANEVDILIGTQMLAKGHDFPALTLVGVLNPDTALYSSDFRAAERLFAQLVQVAGRAGRADKPGEVLVQTAFPEHPLFRALHDYDFEGWAAMQLVERQMAGFPPFVYQAMLRAEGKQEKEVFRYLNDARMAAVNLNQSMELQGSMEMLGVVPAAMPRRANHFRAQLLIQAKNRKVMQQFLHVWQPSLNEHQTRKLRCSLDVDPMEY